MGAERSMRSLAVCYLLIALLAATSVESHETSLELGLMLLDDWLIEKTESNDPKENMKLALSSLGIKSLFQTSHKRSVRLLANLAGINHLEQCSNERFEALNKISECFFPGKHGAKWRYETLILSRLQPILSLYALEAMRACELRLESELLRIRRSVAAEEDFVAPKNVLNDEIIEKFGNEGREEFFHSPLKDLLTTSISNRFADMIAGNHNKETIALLKGNPTLFYNIFSQIYGRQLLTPCRKHPKYFGLLLKLGEIGQLLDPKFYERRSVEYHSERSRSTICWAVQFFEEFKYKQIKGHVRAAFVHRNLEKRNGGAR